MNPLLPNSGTTTDSTNTLPPWIRREGRTFALEDELADDLAQRFGTPLFVYSARQVHENVCALREAFGRDTRIFASYKACTLQGVMAGLHRDGIGAEVCTRFEYALAKSARVHSNRTVWNAVSICDADQDVILADPPCWLGLNTFDDIERMGNAARGAGRTLDVMLRVHPRSARDGYVARGSRLGFDVADGSAFHAVKLISGTKSLRLTGLHYHTDIDQTDSCAATAVLNGLLRDFAGIAGIQPDWLKRVCIGGGLAPAPRFRQSPGALQQFGKAMRQTLQDWPSPIELCVEPGRFFTSDTAAVVTRCLAAHSSGGAEWLIVDANTNCLVPFEGRQFPVVGPRSGLPTVSVGDRMSTATGVIGQVAVGAKPGDLLLVLDAGAYTLSTAQDFMFGGPNVVLLDRGQATLLRKEETPAEWSRRVGGMSGASSEGFFRTWASTPVLETSETLKVGCYAVVHRWEKPLMEAFALHLAPAGKDVLEIGFGMGLSADALQGHVPRKHVIYEPHPEIFARAEAWRAKRDAPTQIVLHPAQWQTICDPHRERFDVVFFDGYSEPGSEHADAERFAALAVQMLRPDGRFGFFCMEPVLSDEIQSMLLRYFETVSIAAVRGLRPTRDFQDMGVESTMIVPIARNPRLEEYIAGERNG